MSGEGEGGEGEGEEGEGEGEGEVPRVKWEVRRGRRACRRGTRREGTLGYSYVR